MNPSEDIYKTYLDRDATWDDLKDRVSELLEVKNNKRKQFSELTTCLDLEKKNLESLTSYLQKRLDDLEKDWEDRRAVQKRIKDKIKEIEESAKTELDQLEREKVPTIETKLETLQLLKSSYNIKNSVLIEKKRLVDEVDRLEKELAQEKIKIDLLK